MAVTLLIGSGGNKFFRPAAFVVVTIGGAHDTLRPVTAPSNRVRVRLRITGRVQGVWYRGATEAEAAMRVRLEALKAKGAPILIGVVDDGARPYDTRARTASERK